MRQPVRGDAPALVGDRDRHVHALHRGAHRDDRRRGRVPCGIRQQVAQNLHDTTSVGHHVRQVRRQLYPDVLPAARAEERVPGVVHQHGQVRRFRLDRERSRLDVRHVQQVVDQIAHAPGLTLYDAHELHDLRRVAPGQKLNQRRGGTPDGRQRRAQLVTHHAHELRPQPLQLLERRHVLHRHHHRLHLTLVRVDGRGVQQHPHRPAVRNLKHHLLRKHRLPRAEHLRQRKLLEGDPSPIGAPERQYLKEALRRSAVLLQVSHYPRRLTVERHRDSAPCVDDRHAHGRGADQGFQVRSCAPFVAVPPRVGYHQRRLRGERHQRLLVLLAELRGAFLPGQKEAAGPQLPVMHGSSEKRGRGERRAKVPKPLRPQVTRQVAHSERLPHGAEVLEHLRPVGKCPHRLPLPPTQPRGEQILRTTGLVKGGYCAAAGSGQLARSLEYLLEHGLQVQAPVDAQARLAQAGQALLKRLYRTSQLVPAAPVATHADHVTFPPTARLGTCSDLIFGGFRGLSPHCSKTATKMPPL